MGWDELDHLDLFIWWEMKPWTGTTFSWGGWDSSRCEDEQVRWYQKAPDAELYISFTANCLTEISTFLRRSYQSRKLGKNGWCWQKRENSSVRVHFQGLSTNRVLLIFFWTLACSHSNWETTAFSCDHAKYCSLFVNRGLATAFTIWLFWFLLSWNIRPPWKRSSE